MTEQKPMTTANQPGIVPGQQQAQAMPTPNVDPAAAQKRAEEGQKAYDEADKQMTDRQVYERIRAAHPHANQSPEAVKTMLDDYNRLKAEQDKASGQQGQGQNPAQPKT